MGRDFVQVPPTNLVYTTWHTDRSSLLPNTRHAYWEWGLDSSWFSLLLPEWRDYTNKNHQTPIDIAIVPSPQSMLHFEWLTFFLAKICRSVARQFWLPRSLFMACRGWTDQVRLTWNYVGVQNDYRKASWKALNYLASNQNVFGEHLQSFNRVKISFTAVKAGNDKDCHACFHYCNGCWEVQQENLTTALPVSRKRVWMFRVTFLVTETHMLILLTAKRVAPCLNKYLLGKATLVLSLVEDSGLSADTLTQSDALALLSLFDVHA